MGTHASGPSYVKNATTTSTLKAHLNDQDLPFLFKVLSVRTALSIQAHPDLSLAQKLHASDPKNYRDGNHKPEMAIALGGEFEALCGFRRAKDIYTFAKMYDGFGKLIGEEAVEKLNVVNCENSEREAIKFAFEKLMKSKVDDIIESISLMPEACDSSDPVISLFHRLHQQYPNDIGIFCVFFLNHFTLQAGEAVFLAANEPHAYLSGSCIECMATSDNVVRAGLTPKHRDVDVLCSMLTYNSFNGLDEILTKPQKMSADRPNAYLYKSPVPEFSVLRIELRDHETDACIYESAKYIGRSIIICTEGSAVLSSNEVSFNLEFGSIVYLPAHCEFVIESSSNSTVIYQAFEPK